MLKRTLFPSELLTSGPRRFLALLKENQDSSTQHLIFSLAIS
jgi:hypothetical protein